MRETVDITKALADENRIRMLLALVPQELCVCQVIELFGLAPSTVSKHLSILRHARLIDSRKSGRWMHYRVAGTEAPPAAREALEWLAKSVANDVRITEDRRRLGEVLKMDVSDICKRICCK